MAPDAPVRSRTLSRKIAVALLYWQDGSGLSAEDTLALFLDNFQPDNDPENILGVGSAPFKASWPLAREFFAGVMDNLATVDEGLSRGSSSWRLDRFSKVERAIARLSAYELYFRSDIPPKVSLNEAIEMAKEFGDVETPDFVNGILDELRREIARDKGDGPSPAAGRLMKSVPAKEAGRGPEKAARRGKEPYDL
ncbi:MAG: transcription antitermination factor NusB [Deltaproteobacteria bacterium]|jgi:N utilization substance protein B|nr:transcription antitermination factor NusB [Deltaproteobacteria bacterium]